MKLKELPFSIYHTLRLFVISKKTIEKDYNNIIPVIVSLTSIPSRLKTLHITVKSILLQESKPEKIILWLNESLKDSIPKSLKNLEGDFFCIRYEDLTCSHRKLIYSMNRYPNKTIVTCDDDVIYNSKMLKKIYEEHLKHPKKIIANVTRYIKYSENGELMPYKEWTYTNFVSIDDNHILPIGSAGVLYPKNSLDKRFNNSKLFLELAPKADDLWFKMMSLLNNTTSHQSSNKVKGPIPIIGTQRISLKKENVDLDKNRVQWEKLTDYFKVSMV
ncbi:glycosyltransferase [Polaribacter sp. M15]